MGHLPLLPPAEPGRRNPAPFIPLPHVWTPQLNQVALISSLQDVATSGARSTDAILRSVAESATTLTEANGAALALRVTDAVECVARSGALAPEVGTRLNANSGISGECLRTSKALRCNDTETDDRVDAEVCRNLGIRSIAVVPLRGRDGTIGILEAFSSRANAFTPEHVSLLKRLAAIAQEACTSSVPAAELDVPEVQRISPVLESKLSTARIPDAKVLSESTSSSGIAFAPGRSYRRYWIAGGIVLLILTVAVVWATWSQPDEETSANPAVVESTPASQELASPAPLQVFPLKPDARRTAVPRRQDSSPLQKAAVIEREPNLGSNAGDAEQSAIATPAKKPEPVTVEPPSVVTSSNNTSDLGQIVAAPAGLPALDIPISQGVTPAALIHNVQPIYPAEARAQRLEGSVIVEFRIARDGSPQDLRIVSGAPVLAQAASEAIRQWRYQPAALNGSPVAVDKQVTIVFKAP